MLLIFLNWWLFKAAFVALSIAVITQGLHHKGLLPASSLAGKESFACSICGFRGLGFGLSSKLKYTSAISKIWGKCVNRVFFFEVSFENFQALKESREQHWTREDKTRMYSQWMLTAWGGIKSVSETSFADSRIRGPAWAAEEAEFSHCLPEFLKTGYFLTEHSDLHANQNPSHCQSMHSIFSWAERYPCSHSTHRSMGNSQISLTCSR